MPEDVQMRHNRNSLKGVAYGVIFGYIVSILGLPKGDTRSSDYSSYVCTRRLDYSLYVCTGTYFRYIGIGTYYIFFMFIFSACIFTRIRLCVWVCIYGVGAKVLLL